MSLTAGTITCRTYRVTTPPVGDFLPGLQPDLRRHTFQPVRPDRASRSMGWVSPRNLLDTSLRVDHLVFGDFLVLGLRVDKITVNARVLKAHFAQAVQQVLRERSKKQLSREERTAILEKTKLELMAKQTPATSVYEAAWNLRTHRVYFTGTNETLNAEFCDLFQETFHVGLTPLHPVLRAEAKARKENIVDALMQAKAARFSPLAAGPGADKEA
jgi:hypothetical protein